MPKGYAHSNMGSIHRENLSDSGQFVEKPWRADARRARARPYGSTKSAFNVQSFQEPSRRIRVPV